MALSDGVTVGRALWKALMPTNDPDPIVQYHWRRAVAFAVILLALCGLGGVGWAQGWIPGMSGVALASDLKAVDVRLTNAQATNDHRFTLIQLLLVKQTIKTEMVNRCAARMKNDQEALDAANDQLTGLEESYRQLQGYSYTEPSCDVVLVATPLAHN